MAVENVNKGFVYITDFTVSLNLTKLVSRCFLNQTFPGFRQRKQTVF